MWLALMFIGSVLIGGEIGFGMPAIDIFALVGGIFLIGASITMGIKRREI
jgi:hypothetical protein